MTDAPPSDLPSARRLALDALARIEEGSYANLVVPAILTERGGHLEERDRAFVTELAYGVTRYRRALSHVVERHLKQGRRPDSATEDVLHLGAYQLGWLGTPPHAAVSETVALAPERTKGFVNAVLRKVAAEGPAAGRKDWPDLATELSYPDWIVRRLRADLGPAAADAALRTMDERPEVTTRADGYTQDRASTWVAEAVRGPGRTLDLCAAPGGKATWMAQAEGVTSVVAADLQQHRARLVANNAERTGTAGCVLALVADGRRPPFPDEAFDRVLVDAPCSGLGVLRRRPDARWRMTAKDADALPELQRDLLSAAIPLLAPGGELAYSVCTLLKAETAAIDRWLATEHPELTPLPPPPAPWKPAGRGALLLPQAAGTDGMFLLRLRAPTSG